MTGVLTELTVSLEPDSLVTGDALADRAPGFWGQRSEPLALIRPASTAELRTRRLLRTTSRSSRKADDGAGGCNHGDRARRGLRPNA
jgi:hypothetical protein